jgi:hypothetical protein
MYRRTKKRLRHFKTKMAGNEINLENFDYLRSDYSVIVNSLNNIYFTDILNDYVIYSLDFCNNFKKAAFKKETTRLNDIDRKAVLTKGIFNASYLVNLLEYFDAIPTGNTDTFETNFNSYLNIMDFELNEMKEIKSTEYDFTKIIEKLSGLDDVKGYTPPVVGVKRIPDLDLIINCAGDNINSQNYYKSLCDPMTEVRKKTCYELSTPETNFVTDQFEEHARQCDNYINQVEEAYTRYTEIQGSDATPQEKTIQIREIYASLNEVRNGIYSTMNVPDPVVVAPVVPVPNDDVQVVPAVVTTPNKEKRERKKVVKYSDENPGTFTGNSDSEAEDRDESGTLDEPDDVNSDSDSEAEDKSGSDSEAEDKSGSDSEAEDSEKSSSLSEPPSPSVFSSNAISSSTINPGQKEKIDGGSLKNNKKRKTIKMNLRRGLKNTIKKR